MGRVTILSATCRRDPWKDRLGIEDVSAIIAEFLPELEPCYTCHALLTKVVEPDDPSAVDHRYPACVQPPAHDWWRVPVVRLAPWLTRLCDDCGSVRICTRCRETMGPTCLLCLNNFFEVELPPSPPRLLGGHSQPYLTW